MRPSLERFIFFFSLLISLVSANANDPLVHVLAPGFEVRELPVKLSNINGLSFARDGRLTALGYDGRIHLLSDSDKDGLEDKSELFWDKQTISVPVGMVWAPEGLYVTSHGKVSLLKDHNGDLKADEEEIIAQGWPATDVATGGTDAVGIARDAEGNIFFGLLVADYSNPYRIGKDGQPKYTTNSIRGTIQKWSPKTKKLETVCTGIRVPFALGFNKVGDLFNTDQEGETWCPDGNPLDEFNHIIPGRNYGFPPRHPQYLPNLISEPPVVSFGPQHQSTCGFVFNEPKVSNSYSPAQKLFGPAWWEGDAFVTGESRGQIWRVKLVKTPAGYIGKEFTFARLRMLTTDVAISPEGAMYVSCHSGQPDWGTGPKGEGKLFKITYSEPAQPQPVAAWASTPMNVHVAFDREMHPSVTNQASEIKIEFGDFVSAADRYENLRPPYQVVKHQQTFPRGHLAVKSASLSQDRRTLNLVTAPHPQTVTYALTIPNVKSPANNSPGQTVDVTYTLNGLLAFWSRQDQPGKSIWSSWFPHLESSICRAYMPANDKAPGSGTFELKSRLRLPMGTNLLRFESELPFRIRVGSTTKNIGKETSGVYVAQITAVFEEKDLDFEMKMEFSQAVAGDRPSIRGSYSSPEDPTVRTLPLSSFVLPWAPEYLPPPPMDLVKTELTGGDYERGKNLFFGEKLKCATCHRVRGEGQTIAPDLSNLVSKDPTAVLRDIKDPSATIHPDYVAFNVWQHNGDEASGFIRLQKEESLTVLAADGTEKTIPRDNLKEVRASSVSLMPSGLLDGFTDRQVRDLLVFLTSEPPQRKREEIEKILGSTTAENVPATTTEENSKSIVWVASKQDHGKDQHDYPRCQELWIRLLNQSPQITATNAWQWPTDEQWASANVLVFYFWNQEWNAERLHQIDQFFDRGGGIIVIHSGTIATKNPEQMAERFGLASRSGGHTKYLHTPFDLKIVQPSTHPIVRGMPKQIHFLDEPYWQLIGDPAKVNVLATFESEGKQWPQLWTYEQGKGRVFVSVPGHYTWTHEDPIYRLLILRGIAWAMGEDTQKFESLATVDLSK